MKETLAVIAMAAISIALFAANFASADPGDQTDDSGINPNWVTPGHYHHDNSTQEASCPPPVVEACKCPILPDCPVFDLVESGPSTQEDLQRTSMYYRKFVRRIFDKRRLQPDLSDESFMIRSIQFRLSKQQVEKLKEARTASETDNVVSEIVEQSGENVYYAMAEGSCDSLYSFIVATKLNTILLCVLVAILMIVAISKICNIWWFYVALLSILIIAYSMTYRDCNNRLEVESLVTAFKYDQKNPCLGLSSLFSSITNKISDRENNCKNYLQHLHGLERNICDPLEVTVEMFGRIPTKYFGNIVDEIISIINSAHQKFGWLGPLRITVVIPVFILGLVMICSKFSLIAIFINWIRNRLITPAIATATDQPVGLTK
ncbi:uncharacterized protein LOC134285742 [Aedes albopictus]|uniref:Chloride channel CLIC-like protein 1 n=1 Tax=Aedes albopictus TaxID=7160 RepID=A0ABM1YFG0_AEDAL|nr:hypothetical protein RP20_CCG028039 [Aedes albopictus]